MTADDIMYSISVEDGHYIMRGDSHPSHDELFHMACAIGDAVLTFLKAFEPLGLGKEDRDKIVKPVRDYLEVALLQTLAGINIPATPQRENFAVVFPTPSRAMFLEGKEENYVTSIVMDSFNAILLLEQRMRGNINAPLQVSEIVSHWRD